MNNKLLVSVNMITYLHGNYISKAIESILFQETDFEYDLIIADDCSPDKTKDIVQDFIANHPKGHIIKYFRHKKNIGMQPNGLFSVQRCKGKYISFCEGDDYWTDPLKLQKQVDFLENNLEYGLISTNAVQYNQSTGRRSPLNSRDSNKLICLEDLLFEKNIIYTLTVCMRRSLLDIFFLENKLFFEKWKMGDLPIYLYICSKSKIFYLNEITAVYRLLENSASHSNSINHNLAFIKNSFYIKYYFLLFYFPRNHKLKLRVYSLYLYQSLIANVTYNGQLTQFFFYLKRFYLKNNQVKYFIGSFLQFYKKISSIIKNK